MIALEKNPRAMHGALRRCSQARFASLSTPAAGIVWLILPGSLCPRSRKGAPSGKSPPRLSRPTHFARKTRGYCVPSRLGQRVNTASRIVVVLGRSRKTVPELRCPELFGEARAMYLEGIATWKSPWFLHPLASCRSLLMAAANLERSVTSNAMARRALRSATV